MSYNGILVTGGVGFIGANFVLDWLQRSNERVINFLISEMSQQAHFASQRARRIGVPTQEVRHDDESSSVSAGAVDAGVS